eukprot:scaffold31288_cov36-Phaeocystis_antarctica.AAC.3
MVQADTASDACVEAPCGAESSSKDSTRSSAAFTDYYRHQLGPLLGTARELTVAATGWRGVPACPRLAWDS